MILTEEDRVVMRGLKSVLTRQTIVLLIHVLVNHASITELSTKIGENHGERRSGDMTGDVVSVILYLTVRLVSVTLTGKTLVVRVYYLGDVVTQQSIALVICAQITDLLESGKNQE